MSFKKALEAAVLDASSNLVPVHLGGALGVVYLRPMSTQDFYAHIDALKDEGEENPGARQAKLFFAHARDEDGSMIFNDSEKQDAVKKLLQLPFGVMQKFSTELLKANGLDKTEEKND